MFAAIRVHFRQVLVLLPIPAVYSVLVEHINLVMGCLPAHPAGQEPSRAGLAKDCVCPAEKGLFSPLRAKQLVCYVLLASSRMVLVLINVVIYAALEHIKVDWECHQ